VRTGWSIRAGLLVAVIPLAALGQVGTAQASSNAAQAGGTPHFIPFSISQTMTRVQTLANGTTITRVEVIRTFRDSAGRTRTERESHWGSEVVSREGGVAYLQPRGKSIQILVLDSVKGITMSWQVDGYSKLVTLTRSRQGRPPAGSYTARKVVPNDGPRAETRARTWA
jgi:hypothetical protein